MIKMIKKMQTRDWFFAFLSIAFIVVQTWLDMTMPQYMNKITVLIETPGSEMSEVWKAGGMMLLCSLGSVSSSVATAIFAAWIGSDLGFTLRSDLFNKVQTFSMEEIGHFSTASLITRSTNDIQQVLMFLIMGLQMLIKAPVTASGRSARSRVRNGSGRRLRPSASSSCWPWWGSAFPSPCPRSERCSG